MHLSDYIWLGLVILCLQITQPLVNVRTGPRKHTHLATAFDHRHRLGGRGRGRVLREYLGRRPMFLGGSVAGAEHNGVAATMYYTILARHRLESQIGLKQDRNGLQSLPDIRGACMRED